MQSTTWQEKYTPISHEIMIWDKFEVVKFHAQFSFEESIIQSTQIAVASLIYEYIMLYQISR